MSETQQQLALMQWAQYTRCGAYWLREVLVHVPNGGKRGRIEAAILKGMGVRPGWPDLQLPVPVRDFHGAYWELKDTDGRLSPAQIDCHVMLRSFGYYVGVFHDWAVCSMDILRYLALPGAPHPVLRVNAAEPVLDVAAARRKAQHVYKPGPRKYRKGHTIRFDPISYTQEK